MLESQYQSYLIQRLYDLFPDAIVLKNDPDHIQGIPDLSIFVGNRWAMLEVKTSARAKHQPNQDYYVDTANGMSFAAFIFPENEDEVLYELQRSFQTLR